jgi:hypothetical protein
VAAEATHATQQLGAGLVVSLQELLTALRVQQGGSGALHAMGAMQNTIAAAIAVSRICCCCRSCCSCLCC